MELQTVVNDKLQLILSNGVVDKLVEEQVTKTVVSIVNDLFRDYSDFGRELKKVLSDKMQISLENLKIDEYTVLVCNSIEGALMGTVMQGAIKKVTTHVKQVVGKLEKKSWKLSEIVQVYRDGLYGDIPRVDVEVKEESYGRYIYLGECKDTNTSSYRSYSSSKAHELTIHLSKKDNKVFAVTNHGIPIDPREVNPNHWQVFMMQLWAEECVIELDEEEAQYIGENESDN